MRRLVFLSVGLLILPILFQIGLAQTAKAASPHVPVTYPGDTAETITSPSATPSRSLW